MPRDFVGSFQTTLGGTLLPLATCCRVERLDGTILGFTSFDRDLTVDGVLYEADTTVDASSVRQSEGGGVDNLDIVGLINSARVTETDLLAGLYDGASVELFIVNWADVRERTQALISGTLGEITEREGQFTAEIRSLSQRLGQQIGQLTAPVCRVREFGDSECIPPGDPLTTLVLAAHQFTRTVSSVTSNLVIVFGSDTNIDSYYRYGRVVFSTGANAGFAREVKAHDNSGSTAIITLQEAFPFEVQAGDTAMLEAGCDRTLGRCTFFGNTINMAAEPYLPGNWLVLRRGRR